MNTQFLTDKKGKKVAAVIPIKEYEELMEDLIDISACLEVKDEKTVPWEQVKKEIFSDAAVPD
jgi:hypothetical protein